MRHKGRVIIKRASHQQLLAVVMPVVAVVLPWAVAVAVLVVQEHRLAVVQVVAQEHRLAVAVAVLVAQAVQVQERAPLEAQSCSP